MFERLSFWHLGAFFRLKSFFLNSDSEGKMEIFFKKIKKFYFFFNF